MLTQQLRELEHDGLVVRQAIADRRRHVEYSLSPLGVGLAHVVQALADWSKTVPGAVTRDRRAP